MPPALLSVKQYHECQVEEVNLAPVTIPFSNTTRPTFGQHHLFTATDECVLRFETCGLYDDEACDKKDFQLGVSLGAAPLYDIMVNTLLGAPYHNKPLKDFHMCCHQSGISPKMFASDLIELTLNGRCSKALAKTAPNTPNFTWSKGATDSEIKVFDKIFS